ncbi:LysE family translocator [uncultured Pelagimonas sp.]|uniref:LysE family translocator n=1 Tax=uncultured Pelagimonas sp. TaxID=1618102 RepID=UPI002602CB2A|nr:LysE family translocator [uncultured Pelagimonas sp.]
MPSLLPIAFFAFTMSFLPGPVNIITLASGLQNGVRPTLGFVTGATFGFAALLAVIGVGMAELPETGGVILDVMTWVGAGLIVYIAMPLFRPNALGTSQQQPIPTFLQGALLQWLNPKAWGAILAALSLFNLRPGSLDLVWVIGMWSVLCFIGVGFWAVFGAQMQRLLGNPAYMTMMCRVMGSVLLLLVGIFLWRWAQS